MFENAVSFNGDINGWQLGLNPSGSGNAVDDLRDVFLGAASFNRGLGAWNVSTVTSIQRMFEGATGEPTKKVASAREHYNATHCVPTQG